MGEMADYYLEQSIGEEFHEECPQPTATIWVTRDGQRIRVKDMTDSHLVNTIRYLRRTAALNLMEQTLSVGQYLDGDPPDGAWMAAHAAEQELNDMDDDDYLNASCPTFSTMLREAEKRKLQPWHQPFTTPLKNKS